MQLDERAYFDHLRNPTPESWMASWEAADRGVQVLPPKRIRNSGGPARDAKLEPLIARVKARLLELAGEHGNISFVKFDPSEPRDEAGRWTTGGDYAGIVAAVKADRSLLRYTDKTGDKVAALIAAARGVDGPPHVVDGATFNKLTGYTTYYRGVEKPSFVQLFRSGPFRATTGLQGPGIFAAKDLEGAGWHGCGAYHDEQMPGGAVMRIAVPEDFKTIDLNDALAQMKAEAAAFKGDPDERAVRFGPGVSDEHPYPVGRWAALAGYDAVTSRGLANDGAIMILNRSGLYTDSATMPAETAFRAGEQIGWDPSAPNFANMTSQQQSAFWQNLRANKAEEPEDESREERSRRFRQRHTETWGTPDVFKYDDSEARDDHGRWTSGEHSDDEALLALGDDPVRWAARDWSGGGFSTHGFSDVRDALARGADLKPGEGSLEHGQILLDAANKAEPTSYRLFRGFPVTESAWGRLRDEMQPGARINLNLSSWTRDPLVAKSFAEDYYKTAGSVALGVAPDGSDYAPRQVMLTLDAGAHAYDATNDIVQGPRFSEHLTAGTFEVESAAIRPAGTAPGGEPMNRMFVTLKQVDTLTAPQLVGTKAATPQPVGLHWLEGYMGQRMVPETAQKFGPVGVAKVSPLIFTDEAAKLLQDAYEEAFNDGWDETDTDSEPSENEVSDVVEQAGPELQNSIAAIAALMVGGAITAAALAARLGQFAAMLNSAYDIGFGSGMSSIGEVERATWVTEGDGHVCILCDARDGAVWHGDAAHPYPGQGYYGEVCEGGPNCRCSITYELVPSYEQPDEEEAPIDEPYDPTELAAVADLTKLVEGDTDLSKFSTAQLLSLRRLALKYSPDQPRDDHGRWTSGGDSSSPWEHYPDSRAAYKVGDSYTPERTAEHEKILAGIFAGHSPSADPTILMLGGGPASGKSSGIRSGAVQVPPDAVSINADDVKKQLSDFQEMRDAGRKDAAAWVHEEGSELSKDALKQAAAGGYNVVYDSTGDNSLTNLEGKVASYVAAGYTVNADYMTVPVETALERVEERGNNPDSPDYGRFVAESVVRSTYASLSTVVPAAIDEKLWTNFHLWNNDNPPGVAPTLIASYENRGALAIADQAAWDKFLGAAGKIVKVEFYTDENGVVRPVRDSEGYDPAVGDAPAPAGPSYMQPHDIARAAAAINRGLAKFKAAGGTVEANRRVSSSKIDDYREKLSKEGQGPGNIGRSFAGTALGEQRFNVAVLPDGRIAGVHGYGQYTPRQDYISKEIKNWGGDSVLGHGIFGTTGIAEGTGSALVAMYLRQAAAENASVVISPIDQAQDFWAKMGFQHTPENAPAGGGYYLWGMTADDVKSVVAQLKS